MDFRPVSSTDRQVCDETTSILMRKEPECRSLSTKIVKKQFGKKTVGNKSFIKIQQHADSWQIGSIQTLYVFPYIAQKYQGLSKSSWLRNLPCPIPSKAMTMSI